MALLPNQRSLQLLIFSYFVNTVGSAATWTGLPTLLVKVSGKPEHGAALFLCETVAALLMTIFGGYLADRIARKQVVVTAALVNALAMGSLALAFTPERIALVYVVGIVVGMVNALALASQAAWFGELAKSQGLEQALGARGAAMSLAKLAGMSLGPILFLQLGAGGIAIDGLSYLFAACLCIFATGAAPTPIARKASVLASLVDGFRVVVSDAKIRGLVYVSAATGLIGFPVINAASMHVHRHGADWPNAISWFWIAASTTSFLTNLAISRGLIARWPRGRVIALAHVVLAAAFVGMATSPDLGWFIAAFCLFPLVNPIVNALLVAAVYRAAPVEAKGRVLAFDALATDLATAFGLAVFTGLGDAAASQLALLAFLPLVALRSWLAAKALVPSTSESAVCLAKPA